MLLASQTSTQSPALWICQATIAARLRCSTATVTRAIQKLVEAKLIAETGKLHEGRYKFYHVRWSHDENIKAVSKKITKPVRKVVAAAKTQPKLAPKPTPRSFEGVQLTLPPVAQIGEMLPPLTPYAPPPPPALPSTLSPAAAVKDDRIAHFAEIARKRHEENLRRYRPMYR